MRSRSDYGTLCAPREASKIQIFEHHAAMDLVAIRLLFASIHSIMNWLMIHVRIFLHKNVNFVVLPQLLYGIQFIFLANAITVRNEKPPDAAARWADVESTDDEGFMRVSIAMFDFSIFQQKSIIQL